MSVNLNQLKEAIKAIDSPNATCDDYKKYFDVFGVSLQNEDGSYKLLYDIFEEASKSEMANKLRSFIKE